MTGLIGSLGASNLIMVWYVLNRVVTHSSGPWAIGGRVEQRHASHDQLFGIRARDGHLYWQWCCDFVVTGGETGDLFAPL